MSKEILLNKLNSLIKPIVEENDCELYYIELAREDGEEYLRVYIDTENGVSMDDCIKVNRAVSEMLDIEDPIEYSYYLEISSPGIERKLYTEDHYNKYISSEVKIKLKKLHDGRKKYEGILIGFNEEMFNIESEGTEIHIPREKVSSIRLKGEY